MKDPSCANSIWYMRCIQLQNPSLKQVFLSRLIAMETASFT